MLEDLKGVPQEVDSPVLLVLLSLFYAMSTQPGGCISVYVLMKCSQVSRPSMSPNFTASEGTSDPPLSTFYSNY